MSEFAGMRITVIGLGKAGSSVARALAEEGAAVRVVDQKPADSLEMIERMDNVAAKDIEIVTSWTGDIDWEATDLIVPSPGVPASHPALVSAVARQVRVWSEMEIGYRLAKAPIVAITGTNGKSTVAAMTHHIITEAGKPAVLCGNIAGSGLEEFAIATAASQTGADGVLVAEVSSFQLEWIDRFRPSSCTITRISQDHLDRYSSFEEYASIKRRIYMNQSGDDTAVVNLARPETYEDLDIRADRLTYDGPEADIMVSDDQLWFVTPDIGLDVAELWAPGRHNLDNAAAAILLSCAEGVQPEDAIRGAASFKGIRHRMEFIADRNGVRFVNNSMCTNPDALLASLEAVQKPVVLLAGGVAKGASAGSFKGIGAGGIRKAVLYGKDAAFLDREFAADGVSTETAQTLEDAFVLAVAEASVGDTVFLSPACASFDQFSDFIERGERFRSLVKELVS